MCFIFAILLCAITQTLVSALPISDVQGEIDARDEFDVAPLRRALYDDAQIFKRARPPKPYKFALHRTNVGKPNEHWALHFHPAARADATGAPNTYKHIVHATSDPREKGFLQTVEQGAHDYIHGQQEHRSIHHVIGEFSSHGDAKRAIKAIKGINLDEKFPTANCADWTKEAVKHMVDHKLMTAHSNGVDTFNQMYDINKDTVRRATGNQRNKIKAGLQV